MQFHKQTEVQCCSVAYLSCDVRSHAFLETFRVHFCTRSIWHMSYTVNRNKSQIILLIISID